MPIRTGQVVGQASVTTEARSRDAIVAIDKGESCKVIVDGEGGAGVTGVVGGLRTEGTYFGGDEESGVR